MQPDIIPYDLKLQATKISHVCFLQTRYYYRHSDWDTAVVHSGSQHLGTIWHLKTQQFFPFHDTILEQFIIEPNQPMEKVPKHKIICRCVQNK